MRSHRSDAGRGSLTRTVALLLLACCCMILLIYSPPQTRVESHSHVAVSNTKSKSEPNLVIAMPEHSSGCGGRPPLLPGTSGGGALISGRIRRTYWLHLPAGYQSKYPYPLVLNFHGYASSAQAQEMRTGFSQLADEKGFIVAYPQGAIGPGGKTGWASGAPNRPTTDDVGFVSNLLDNLEAKLCVNLQRIYATGFSNGGGMTALLACRMADRIAAFASVSGSYYPLVMSCDPGRAVPILEIHGTNDSTVPYNGNLAVHEMPVMDWLQHWANEDGCRPQPVKLELSTAITVFEWTGCGGGSVVVHYRLAGGIHTWPSGVGFKWTPLVDRQLDANALIWDFFSAHQLAREL